MELVRDMLDKQIVDRNQVKMGKVDGLVFELREREPPRVAFIEVGAVSLARRIGHRTGQWVSRLAAHLGGESHREPYRIPWERVRDIGLDIDLDLDVKDTPVFDWQTWLRDHVIARVPGA
jgi:sporulation protein YlmC with PRC-barrel domain